MKTKSTDHLIADVLSMAMEIRQHVEDRRRRVTPLQMEGLSNAVLAIHNYLASWKAHELTCRDASLIRASNPPISSRIEESRHAENPTREIIEGHLNPDAGFTTAMNQSVF